MGARREFNSYHARDVIKPVEMSETPAPLPPAEPPQPGSPPPASGMQFDRAESLRPSAPAAACAVCKKALTDVYYLARSLKVCPVCREGHERQLASGSQAGRVIKALILGSLAAGLGGAIWAFITYKTDGIYGIVAIGMGLLIGAAVKKGSEGRGGRGYQALALALTYLGVAIGYSGAMIPLALKGKPAAVAEKAEKAEKAEEEKTPPSAEPGKTAPAKASEAGCLVVLVTLLGIFVASPVLIGIGSPVTFVFLAIALYEAWKLNRGAAVRLAGPFRLGASSSERAVGG
jgi:hypothetical protein